MFKILILPCLTLIFVPLLGVSTGVSAVNFSKLGSWFKNLARWDPVTPKRCRVGIGLLVIGVVTGLVLFDVFL